MGYIPQHIASPALVMRQSLLTFGDVRKKLDDFWRRRRHGVPFLDDNGASTPTYQHHGVTHAELIVTLLDVDLWGAPSPSLRHIRVRFRFLAERRALLVKSSLAL